MAPTWLEQLDEAFANNLRLAIISALLSGDMDFNMLKKVTGGTDGNLSIQTRKLEEYGYLTSTKSFIDRKPRTTYKITIQGKEAFQHYVFMLERVLKNKNTNNNPG
jgi:DNA-binding HxlR family transcriptional regulator